MNLDDFIITCFCLIDEMIPMITKDHRLRARGPAPKLWDSEVMTMEVVGSYLGLSQDQELFDYFQRHYTHFFPLLLVCTGQPLCGKRPICGRSKSTCGAGCATR
jgi:hypothetical protein